MTSISQRATVTRRHDPNEASRPGRLARPILVAFLFTFMAARVLVFLIVSRRIPDVYLKLGGTHVHHLNYGIFLLSAVGAYLLLGYPGSRGLRWAAALYGIGLALVQKILVGHGGDVSVEKSNNFGTVFHCRLPLIAQHSTVEKG